MTAPLKDTRGLKLQVQKLQEINTINIENYAQLKDRYDTLWHNHRGLQEAYHDVYRRMLKAESIVAFLRRFLAAN